MLSDGSVTARGATRDRSLTSRRWRLLSFCLLIGASLAISACGSSNSPASSKETTNLNKAATNLGTVLYGTLPPVGTPVSGGIITQGQLTGETPTYIFPIAPGANSSTGTFSLLTELNMPLYAGPTGAEPKINYALSAAAGPPVGSNGDKTYTVTLKSGLKFSNGTAITSKDVLFWYYLVRAAVDESPANWGQYSPPEFPEDVTSASAPTPTTVVFNLNKAYNPGFFLNNQLADTNGGAYPLPSTVWNVDSATGAHLNNWTNIAVAKKIYDYLNKQGSSVATFASDPLWQDGSGPFKLKSFSATNSSYSLVPNPNYGGSPKSIAAGVNVETYTDFTSELNAVKSGSLDVMVGLDPSQLPQVPQLKTQGIAVFGGPSWGWFGGQINFLDTTDDFNKVISQLYVRQAIDRLTDQPGIINGVYKGAAVTAYGPTPTAPISPYAPSDAATAPYPYSPSAAVALLKSHGWKVVPGGQTTCAKAGTAADECGAGIPVGTPIKFVWANVPSSVSTTGPLESEVLASEAKTAAGINITLQTKEFSFLIASYNDQNPAGLKDKNDWGINNYGGLFEDDYPTQDGVENPGAGFNIGSFDDPTANKLMKDSVFSTNPDAVKTEASYFENNPPVIYLPDEDYLLAVNTKAVGGQPDGWTSMTQQQWFPQYWYTVK
jgi:peptide/nickel transport system substrate-binding protein